MSERAILISGDTHLGNNHTNFTPYFDPEHRQAYEDFLEMAEMAAKVQAERLADEASGKAGGDAMTMMAAAPGRMLDMLLDRNETGAVPYSKEFIAENQKMRRELIASLGYDKFDETEFMTVLGEDDPD